MSDAIITIPAGNSIQVTVTWKDADDQPEAPTIVGYRVVDPRTGNDLAADPELDNLGAEMTFVVPGDDLPGSEVGDRKLVVVVEASFAGIQDKHTELIDVTVRRAY